MSSPFFALALCLSAQVTGAIPPPPFYWAAATARDETPPVRADARDQASDGGPMVPGSMTPVATLPRRPLSRGQVATLAPRQAAPGPAQAEALPLQDGASARPGAPKLLPAAAAAVTPAPEVEPEAGAAPAGDMPPPKAAALAADPTLDDELLAPAIRPGEDVPDNSSDLSLDVDRWLLHDLLAEGVAQTPYWRAAFVGARDGGPLLTTNQPDDWQNGLRLARVSALLSGLPQQHHLVDERHVHFDIPLATHPLVDLYIDYFTGRGRWFFERWLNRGSVVMPMMRQILAAEGVPQDLVYLAMVESGFSAHAYSSAAAVGYWQFIASTGSTYGLMRDRFVDERRDFVRATHGAARFLATLHRHLGDWHLAWASYNAGEARIRRAMAKTGAKTFWQLIARPHNLAKETVHYVPKIIAAAIVAKDAARYGFHVTEPTLLTFDTVPVRGALELGVLAKHTQTPLSELRALNPSLLYDMTPPNRTSQLRVPKGSRQQTEAAIARLPSQKRVTYAAYRVRRGDTLSGIARRLHSTVDTLRQFNRLQGRVLKPGTELVVPSFRLVAPEPTRLARAGKAAGRRSRAATTPKFARVALASKTQGAPKGSKRHVPRAFGKVRARHVVASGDTLWSIARRYGVSLNALRGRARRGDGRIAVGEIIDIF